MWLLITDPMKLLAYRILDPVNALHHPEAKAKTRAPADLTPQIAKRAFELYGGARPPDGRAVQG